MPDNPEETGNNELNNDLLNEDVNIRFIDTLRFDTKKDVKITKEEIE